MRPISVPLRETLVTNSSLCKSMAIMQRSLTRLNKTTISIIFIRVHLLPNRSLVNSSSLILSPSQCSSHSVGSSPGLRFTRTQLACKNAIKHLMTFPTMLRQPSSRTKRRIITRHQCSSISQSACRMSPRLPHF